MKLYLKMKIKQENFLNKMDSTILDRCDLEEYSEENLYDLYELVIREVDRRELTKEFDERAGF